MESHLYKYVSAFFAFALWGSWAYYVNTTKENPAFLSAFSQATASFIITLLMVKGVTFFNSFFHTVVTSLILPPLIVSFITAICLFSIHSIIGTRDIVTTLWPALTVGFIFCCYSSYRLNFINKEI
ncbi:MAG: hypothetical protein GY694_19520 [Gammaproteobacteria bacterium]|nr:hypothetical protein [Gammaproteobacteria bacterium]